MPKLSIQKHNYHPLAENSWLMEKHLSLWQEAMGGSITLVFRTTTCASPDRLKTANRAIKGFSFIFRVYCWETTVPWPAIKKMKISHQVGTTDLPFSLWTPLFFSYPPKAICFTWCFWCIKPHMFLPQLLLGPWMTHVLYYHWHFWALNVTCWKKARWPN